MDGSARRRALLRRLAGHQRLLLAPGRRLSQVETLPDSRVLRMPIFLSGCERWTLAPRLLWGT